MYRHSCATFDRTQLQLLLAGIELRSLDTKTQPAVLPKSNFAEVVRYVNNSWKALTSYVETGYVRLTPGCRERLPFLND
jgi:hypothetical protein